LSGPPDPLSSTISWYDANAHSFRERTQDLQVDSLYEPFLALLPPGARILDAGCGSGRDGKAFLDLGYDVTAFDASEAMAAFASEHIGRPVLHLRFDEVSFEEQFDGVWACATLLHLPRHEMGVALANLTRALVPGGVLYASLKHGEGEKVVDGRHFTYYTEESLRDVLREQPDLREIKLWRTEDSRPECAGSFWLSALLRKQ
jgi:SAM-dependent methyltransferase